MKDKSLKILVTIAAILLLVSLLIFVSSQNDLKKINHEILVKDFDNILNKISKIQFLSKENKTIIERNENGWVLKNHDNFPASSNELRKFFYNLREAKILELKTAKKNRHYKLGLEEERKITFSLSDNLDNEMLAYELGIYNYLVGGTYIKKINDDQTFLVSANLSTDSEGFFWMSPYLINIGPENVNKLTIMQPFKKKKIFSKNENGDFKLVSPSNKTFDEYIISDVIGNLQDIDIEGYILKNKIKDLSPALKAKYQFTNKSSLMMNFYNINDEIFVTLDFDKIPNSILPLKKEISESFEGNQFEISSNALLNYGFQINKMNFDNLNIQLD
ncbi:MAG: hypothetical protein CMI90_06840 [Pelagibacteraceae bacterium]|nr:hypothetical protein [Pelagibacteraceae bacterium]